MIDESHRMNRLTETPLSVRFFSTTNINNIQNDIMHRAKQETGYTIGRQSDNELFNVLQYVFDVHACHLNTSIDNQIQKLNIEVLKIVMPMVISGVKQYIGYVSDASSMYIPMEHGVSTTTKGENSLSMKPFF